MRSPRRRRRRVAGPSWPRSWGQPARSDRRAGRRGSRAGRLRQRSRVRRRGAAGPGDGRRVPAGPLPDGLTDGAGDCRRSGEPSTVIRALQWSGGRAVGAILPMTALHRLASVPLVLALVLGLAAMPAEGATTSAARRRQAEVRAQKARAAAQLNGLKASDDQLEKAVAALASQVRAQNAKVAAARQAVSVAESAVKQAETRIATTEAETTRLQTAVVDR